jgi:hypothetical protein
VDLSKEYDSHTEVATLLEDGTAKGYIVQEISKYIRLNNNPEEKIEFFQFKLVFDTCFDSFTMKCGQVIGRGKTDFHEFKISGEYDNNNSIWFKFDVLSGELREKNKWNFTLYGSISKNEKNEIEITKRYEPSAESFDCNVWSTDRSKHWVNDSFHFKCQPV